MLGQLFRKLQSSKTNKHKITKTKPVSKEIVDVEELFDAIKHLKNDPITEGFIAIYDSGIYGTSRIQFSGIVIAEIKHLWTAGNFPEITPDGYALGEPLFERIQNVINKYRQMLDVHKQKEQKHKEVELEKARRLLRDFERNQT